MNELDDESIGNFSLPHLSLAIFGMFSIILGLLNEDLVLNVAIFGPFMIYSFGAFVLMMLIESRQGTSRKLDSYVFSKINASSSQLKETRYILSTIILMLACILLFSSIIFISEFNASGFALTLVFSLSLFGISMGRWFGSKIGANSAEPTWPELGPKEQLSEYAALRKWLKIDWDSNVSRATENKINEQKLRFLDRMRFILADQNLTRALLKSFEKEEDLESKLVETLTAKDARATTDWYAGAIRIPQMTDVKKSLHSLLFLPALIELTRFVGQGGSGSPLLFNRLLTLIGKYAIRLDCDDILDSETNLSAISGIQDDNMSSELQRFIKFVVIHATYHPKHQFTPWWILNLRSRMQIAMKTIQWGDVEKSSMKSFSSDVAEDFTEWCYLLSELDSIENFTSSELTSSFSPVLQNIKATNTGSPVVDLLKVTWLAYLKMR